MSLVRVWLGLFQLLVDAIFEFHRAASALSVIKWFNMHPFGDGLTFTAAFGTLNVLTAWQHHRLSLLTVLNAFEKNFRHEFPVVAWFATVLAFFYKAVNEIEHLSFLVLRQLEECESSTINFIPPKEFFFFASRAIVHTFIFNAPEVLVLLIDVRFPLEDCKDLLDVVSGIIDIGTRLI